MEPMAWPPANSVRLPAMQIAGNRLTSPITMSLFRKNQSRSLRTFEDVAMTELPVLYRVAKRLTRNPALAEDLVAQTLLDASKGWDSFDGEYPRSWFIKILRNNHSKAIRTSAARPASQPIEDVELGVSPDFLGDLNWKLIGSRIIEELDTLPEEYRMAVVLCDVEELPYQEAAEIMDVPVGTVRSRLFRGRQMLRTKLAHLMDGVSEMELAGSKN
jgi:RNA polymerase sigma-70 factor, ECF subfamily